MVARAATAAEFIDQAAIPSGSRSPRIGQRLSGLADERKLINRAIHYACLTAHDVVHFRAVRHGDLCHISRPGRGRIVILESRRRRRGAVHLPATGASASWSGWFGGFI